MEERFRAAVGTLTRGTAPLATAKLYTVSPRYDRVPSLRNFRTVSKIVLKLCTRLYTRPDSHRLDILHLSVLQIVLATKRNARSS